MFESLACKKVILGFNPQSPGSIPGIIDIGLHEIVTVRIRPVELLFSLPRCGKESATQAVFPGGRGEGGVGTYHFLVTFGSQSGLLCFLKVCFLR